MSAPRSAGAHAHAQGCVRTWCAVHAALRHGGSAGRAAVRDVGHKPGGPYPGSRDEQAALVWLPAVLGVLLADVLDWLRTNFVSTDLRSRKAEPQGSSARVPGASCYISCSAVPNDLRSSSELILGAYRVIGALSIL